MIDMNTPAFVMPQPWGSDVPLNEVALYLWADRQPRRSDVSISNYLNYIGFVIGTHRLEEEDYKIMKYAVECWHRCTPWIREPRKFEDLFFKVLGDSRYPSYWVHGKEGRYTISKDVVEALEQSGWIYDVTPETTFFSVNNHGMVTAAYQHILGSRVVAKLIEQ